MNPQFQNFSQGYKTLGRDPGPWVTQRNNELNAQAVQGMVNSPGFQQIMQQQKVKPEPILSKNSQQLQGAAGPLSEEELNMQAMQGVANNPRFQQFMKNPILSKDSKRLQGLPDTGPAAKEQVVKYSDPLYGQLALTGLTGIGSWLRNRNQQFDKTVNWADRKGLVAPGSEGDYDTNTGFYRPKDYVPVQFRAYPRGPRMMAAEGGSVGEDVVDDGGIGDVIDVPGYFDEEVRDVVTVRPPASTEVLDEASAPAATSKHSKEHVGNIPEPDMSVKLNDATYEAVDYYLDQGLPAHIAAGIGGNTWWESRNNPEQTENGGGPGTGVLQWTDAAKVAPEKRAKSGDRWGDYLKRAEKKGFNPWQKQNQWKYILEEPGWGEKTLAKMYETTTPEEAAIVFGRTNARPKEETAAWSKRAGAARKLYEYAMQRQGKQNQNQAPQEGRNFNLAAAMGMGNTNTDMAGFGYANSTEGGDGDDRNDLGLGFSDQGLLPMVGEEGEEGVGRFERGGEYLVTPKQLKFILANGGEIEFL